MQLKKVVSFRKLAKKVKAINRGDHGQYPLNQELLDKEEKKCCLKRTPVGFFALYVGEEKQRFVVPTEFLSHPLFKMLLEKAYNELCFEIGICRLVVPCSVYTFKEVVHAIQYSNRRFDFGDLIEEFL